MQDVLRPNDAEVVSVPEGTIRIWHPARGIIVTRVEGVLVDRAAVCFEMVARRIVAEDHEVTGFHDWERMTNYETEARVRLTQMARSHGRQFRGAHFLVRSKIVALGIQAANVLVPGLVVYQQRAGFESALLDFVRTRKSRGG